MRAETPVTLGEMLCQPHGDFQNSVSFYDYLDHLEPAPGRMAYGLLAGYSVREVQQRYAWDDARTKQACRALREGMQAYLHV